MTFYELCLEYNKELIKVFSCLPFAISAVLVALVLLGGLIVLTEYIADWWKKIKNG